MVFWNKRYTAQKMKFPIKDFFSKCDQIRSFLRIWSHLLNKSLMENFIFCAVVARAGIAICKIKFNDFISFLLTNFIHLFISYLNFSNF